MLIHHHQQPDTFEEYECAELEETKVNLANLLEQINAMRSVRILGLARKAGCH